MAAKTSLFRPLKLYNCQVGRMIGLFLIPIFSDLFLFNSISYWNDVIRTFFSTNYQGNDPEKDKNNRFQPRKRNDGCMFGYRIIIDSITMDGRRLCHISDLPNSLHFLPIEIKHLLPVHHAKFADNLLTILANQAAALHWPIYLDPSLALATPSSYVSTFAGWCEDIDGQQHHLKATLELSAVILNYLHSLIIAVPAEREGKHQTKVIQRTDVLSDDGPVYAQEGALPTPSLLAYNIYKSKDKQGGTRFVFMVGRQFDHELRIFSMLDAARGWNLRRLKSETCRQVAPARTHRLLEHLVTIFRGFLPLEELDNQMKKRQLQLQLEAMDQQKVPSVVPRAAIEEDYMVNYYRFQWNYKEDQLKKGIFGFCGQTLARVLKDMPRNFCCSYAGRTVHNSKLNQLILLWLTAHKKTKLGRVGIALDEDTTGDVVGKCLKFLQRKSVENIRDGGVNIADQILKSSLKVLNKYNSDVDRSLLQAPGSYTASQQLNDSQSVITERIPQFDRTSALSKVSFRSRATNRSAQDLKFSHLISENFQSLTSPLMVHRDREYSELLGVLQEWEKRYGKIAGWAQVRAALKRNCENARVKYGKTGLSDDEGTLLLSFAALKHYLDPDELQMLVRMYFDHRDSIFQVIFQPGNARVLLEVAKRLAKNTAQQLYQKYLTKQCSLDRRSPLAAFLKRYLITFELAPELPDLGQRVPIPALLNLLENRDFTSQAYRELVAPLLPELFYESQSLRLLAPALHELYIALVEDHHEELVNSLMGDLCFEILYFSYDALALTNSPYRREVDLKGKKFLQVLRDGGFSRLGFELRTVLKPLLFQHRDHVLPQARIYQQICIHRPIHLLRFMQLIIQSQVTQHFLQLARFYRALLRTAQAVTRPLSAVFLRSQVESFRYEVPEERVELAGVKSQSGIFQQLLDYNPQLKIAGLSLSQILQRREGQRRAAQRDRFNVQQVLASELGSSKLEECYEYIVMVVNLRDKYLGYAELREEEKIYLRQIMHQVLCRKTSIYHYLQLDAAIKLAQNRQRTAIY